MGSFTGEDEYTDVQDDGEGEYVEEEEDEEEYADGPSIYEDEEEIGDASPDEQEELDEESGMYGDEEDYMDDDTMQEDSPEAASRHFSPPDFEDHADPVKESGTLVIRTEEIMSELASALAPPVDDEDEFEDDVDMDGPEPISPERRQEKLCNASRDFLIALQEHLPKEKKTEEDSNLHSAYYIASLALPIYHSADSQPKHGRPKIQRECTVGVCSPHFCELRASRVGVMCE